MNRYFYLLSWMGIISALFFMLVFGYWYTYPYKTISFSNLPHKVINKQVKPGGHITFTMDYCKHIELGAEVTVSFVDGFIYNTAPIPSNIDKGCHIVNNSVYVPRAIPEGTYSVRILYRYKVNPFRTIDIISESEKFQVVK